jgi:hypothetical protein
MKTIFTTAKFATKKSELRGELDSSSFQNYSTLLFKGFILTILQKVATKSTISLPFLMFSISITILMAMKISLIDSMKILLNIFSKNKLR